MGATLRIIVEFLIRATFVIVYLAVCYWLALNWLFVLWAGAFTDRPSELALLASFAGGIIVLTLLGFLWRWCDRKIAGRLDQVSR